MADTAEVRLGADTSSLQSAFGAAQDKAKESLKGIGEALKGIASGSRSTEEAVGDSLRAITGHFGKMADGAKSSAGIVGSSFAALRVGVVGAVALMGGAIALAIKGIHDLGEEVKDIDQLRQVFGMTSDEASRMNVALKLIGKSADDFANIGLHLARSVKMDEERMRALGVATRDAAGNLLPLEQIQRNAIDTMQTYRAGVDQDMVALELWGRSAKEVYGYIELTEPIMQRAAELQRELGIEMGPAKRAEIKAYQVETRALSIVWEEMRQTLGEKLMPHLKALTGWLASIGPAAVTIMSAALKTIITILEGFAAIVATVAIAGTAAFEGLMESTSALGRAFMAFIRGQWGAIPGIIRESSARSAAIQQAAADGVRATWSGAYDRIKNLWSTHPITAAGGADGPKAGGRGYTPKATGGAPESRMAQFEAMLKAERDAYERMKLDQGSFERFSEDQVSAFWERIKATYELSTTELLAVEGKWYDAQRALRQQNFESSIAALEAEKAAIKFDYDERIRIAQEAARKIAAAYGSYSKEAIAAEARVTAEMEKQVDQRARLADIEAKRRQAVSEHFVTIGQLEVNQNVALRKISAEQAIAQEGELQSRLYAIREKALREQLALERDPVKISEINARLETLELEHQAKMTEIANKAELERKQYAIAASQALQDNFANVLDGLADGTKKWTDVLKDGIKGLTADLRRLASQQVAKALLGPGTTGGGFFGNIFGKIFGGGAALDPLAAAKTKEAASSTAAATAIDLMSAAAASATAALAAVGGGSAAGGLGSLFGGGSGSGGFESSAGFGAGELAAYAVGTPYVPQDSLAVVHKGEAIIPARYNRSGAGGGLGSLHQQFVVNGPVDTRTQYQIAEAAARGARIAFMRVGG